MFDSWKRFSRAAGDTLRGRVRGDEIRVFGFEAFQLMEQAVELLVRDFRRVPDVVTLLVMPDLAPEVLDSGERVQSYLSRERM
jgi:hypothetical protein